MYERLKEACKQKGTTVTVLCIEVTGSSGNLPTWKKGYMRSDYLLKCAEILNVSTDYLLKGEESRTIQNSIVGNNNTRNVIGNNSQIIDDGTKNILKLMSIKEVDNVTYNDLQDRLNSGFRIIATNQYLDCNKLICTNFTVGR